MEHSVSIEIEYQQKNTEKNILSTKAIIIMILSDVIFRILGGGSLLIGSR